MRKGIFTRSSEAIGAAVVLGLSAYLISEQRYGSVPPIISFAAFCGAFAIVASFIGLVSLYVDEGFLPKLAFIMDVLGVLLFAAAGIALAVGLRTVSCGSAWDKIVQGKAPSSLVTGGCDKASPNDLGECYFHDTNAFEDFVMQRCRIVQANSAFAFLAVCSCIEAATLSLKAIQH